jgi:hypothetical protein
MSVKDKLICLVVVAAVGAIATPAAALNCTRPKEPSLPRGNATNIGEMKNAANAVQTYLTAMRDYVQCLTREANEAADEANSLREKWNNEVSQFNSQ